MAAAGAEQPGHSVDAGSEEPQSVAWLGPPTRQEDGKTYFAGFAAGGVQYSLGERGRRPAEAGAKQRRAAELPDACTITSTPACLPVGDHILLRPSDPSLPPYIAKLESLHEEKGGGGGAGPAADGSNRKVAAVRWYARRVEPEGLPS